ncbi:monocarboxylate transporter 9-like isoform X2 [Galleria mellonella]|uniref:Monocarboxylate transporter 9-like isoform X2 n=1 Tax=Galleria mellonella TaxID=7137 RepID=A0ABM3N613_GALME|nr:monocarboxylate transporter 9-like isoform X2 [Galleria mellonella]
MILIQTITSGFGACFGLIYNDLINTIGMGSTMITIFTGIGVLVNAFFGFITSPLLKILSFRQVAFIAAIMYNIGVFGTYFVQSMVSFLIFYSLLLSAGFGLLLNLTSTIVNDYFTSKRLLTVSLTQTAVGVNCMLLPKLVAMISNEYGSRGCILIISGISTHLFVAVALMQPIKWHMKKEELPENNDESLILLVNPPNEGDKTPVVTMSEIKPPNKTVTEKTDTSITLSHEKRSRITILISELFDKSVMKIFFSSIIIIGPACSFFCDLTFYMIFPQALYSLQWNYEHVAWAISLLAFGDTAARALFIVLNNWLYRIGIEELYIIGLGIAFLSRIGMLLSKDTIPVLVYMTIIGVSRCFFIILAPLVMVNAVGVDKFTAVNGIYMLTVGILGIALGPLTGAVRDMTGSYTIVFAIMAGILLLIMLIWIIELYYKKRKCKSQRKTSVNQYNL